MSYLKIDGEFIEGLADSGETDQLHGPGDRARSAAIARQQPIDRRG